jgi:hypothetical protein
VVEQRSGVSAREENGEEGADPGQDGTHTKQHQHHDVMHDQ